MKARTRRWGLQNKAWENAGSEWVQTSAPCGWQTRDSSGPEKSTKLTIKFKIKAVKTMKDSTLWGSFAMYTQDLFRFCISLWYLLQVKTNQLLQKVLGKAVQRAGVHFPNASGLCQLKGNSAPFKKPSPKGWCGWQCFPKDTVPCGGARAAVSCWGVGGTEVREDAELSEGLVLPFRKE